MLLFSYIPFSEECQLTQITEELHRRLYSPIIVVIRKQWVSEEELKSEQLSTPMAQHLRQS